MLPVAVDAMGGDHAPSAIVAGAELAAEDGLAVVLVGQANELATDLDVIEASEVIAMDADPASSVRTMKDSSIVVGARSVPDGLASGFVSAGNTGAAMAASLLRMKRIKGVKRPAIATPLPMLTGGTPNVMVDSGANADCQPEWMAQFARMGAVYARTRYGVEAPRVGLLSIGEEASKGSTLVKDTHKLLAESGWQEALGCTFIGNIEGRDLIGPDVDVIVTDGFTGNVALKTLEGTAKSLIGALLEAFESSDEARQGAELLVPALAPLYARANPDTVGGAALLGVNGVSIISHGSSSAEAIRQAIGVAHDLAASDMVASLETALAV